MRKLPKVRPMKKARKPLKKVWVINDTAGPLYVDRNRKEFDEVIASTPVGLYSIHEYLLLGEYSPEAKWWMEKYTRLAEGIEKLCNVRQKPMHRTSQAPEVLLGYIKALKKGKLRG